CSSDLLRLRNVGSGHLADGEAILRSLELALDHPYVVLVELHHREIAEHVHIGRSDFEQNLLLDRLKSCALRLNVLLRSAGAGYRAAAAKERLRYRQAIVRGITRAGSGGADLIVVGLENADACADAHRRPPARQGLR